MSSPMESALVFGGAVETQGLIGLEFNNVLQSWADGAALMTLGNLWAWHDIWVLPVDAVTTSWTDQSFGGTTIWTDYQV